MGDAMTDERQPIHRWAAEVDRLRRDIVKYHNELSKTNNEADRLREENEKLRFAIEEYATHKPSCDVYRCNGSPCTCGWLIDGKRAFGPDALSATYEALKDTTT